MVLMNQGALLEDILNEDNIIVEDDDDIFTTQQTNNNELQHRKTGG